MARTLNDQPLLESGDRLSREEFHRRYCLRPEIKKAELVEGVVYVPSPVRVTAHGEPHALAVWWLNCVAMLVSGIRVGDNTTVILDDDNEVQPDVCLFRDDPRPGETRINDAGYLEGPPILVMEIASSSASYDLHDKKRAYERNGVPEYVVWRVIDARIDWFRLRKGAYIRVEPDERGMIESPILPGLRLDVPAVLAGDRARVLETLHSGTGPRAG